MHVVNEMKNGGVVNVGCVGKIGLKSRANKRARMVKAWITVLRFSMRALRWRPVWL